MSKRADAMPVEPGAMAREGFGLLALSKTDEAQRTALLDIRNAPDVRASMYDDQPIPLASHLAWCDRISASVTDHLHVVLRGGLVIGSLGFRAISWPDARCDWAFYLGDGARGLGLGRWLEGVALRHAFCDMRMQKLNCEVLAFNSNVLALHAKFGFRTEGIRRDHVFRSGAYHDVHLLGMTRDDYADAPHLRESHDL